MSYIAHLYKITNQKTGDYYIGKHNGWEQNNYWGSGHKVKGQIKKYGKENFTYDILCYGSPEYIYELENKLVTIELIESDEKCLNLTIGGDGPTYHKKETRQKISKKLKLAMTPELRKKISDVKKEFYKNNPEARAKCAANTGKVFSEEQRKLWSDVQIERFKDPKQREKLSQALKGKKVSEEAKKKISLKNKGKIRTEETKELIRQKRALQIIPKEVYALRSEKMKGITWMNDGIRNYRIMPNKIEEVKQKGYVLGRLTNYITEEYKNNSKNTALKMWQKIKNAGCKNPKEYIGEIKLAT
jgi:hypothetical protein